MNITIHSGSCTFFLRKMPALSWLPSSCDPHTLTSGLIPTSRSRPAGTPTASILVGSASPRTELPLYGCGKAPRHTQVGRRQGKLRCDPGVRQDGMGDRFGEQPVMAKSAPSPTLDDGSSGSERGHQ